MKSRFKPWMLAAILFGAFALTGCPPKKKLAIEEKPTNEKVEEAATDTNKENTPSPDDIQIQQDWTEIPNLQVAQFAYDSASLDEAGRAALKTNVSIIKKLPASVMIRVEGHCDDRGTVEYNIALGQRRANAVKSYYATAGVGRARLDTISFGEERPVCTEENESCWSRNRRGTTKVKNSEPITIKKDSLQ